MQVSSAFAMRLSEGVGRGRLVSFLHSSRKLSIILLRRGQNWGIGMYGVRACCFTTGRWFLLSVDSCERSILRGFGLGGCHGSFVYERSATLTESIQHRYLRGKTLSLLFVVEVMPLRFTLGVFPVMLFRIRCFLRTLPSGVASCDLSSTDSRVASGFSSAPTSSRCCSSGWRSS